MDDSTAAKIRERLTRIEKLLADHQTRDYYTTAEAARLLSRATYTVRAWCRDGRARAEKRNTVRGGAAEWTIPREELEYLRSRGPRLVSGSRGPRPVSD
jgi:hypothetical protein